MTDDKIPVFSRGPWLLEETGQRFTGNQLDAAAFAKYRAALAECQERRNETIAMCEHLRAQVKALRAERDALIERVSEEQDRCAMEVWYTMQKYLADPDDDGVEHWLREAELAIRSRAAIDAAMKEQP